MTQPNCKYSWNKYDADDDMIIVQGQVCYAK